MAFWDGGPNHVKQLRLLLQPHTNFSELRTPRGTATQDLFRVTMSHLFCDMLSALQRSEKPSGASCVFSLGCPWQRSHQVKQTAGNAAVHEVAILWRRPAKNYACDAS